MPRPEKVAAVAEIKERFEGARAVFLAEYSGLSVKAQQELRRGLRAQGAEFKVVKMTLTRRAAAELELEELDELLVGPTGIAFADDDAVNAAKALKDFATSHEALVIKGGLLGRSFLTPERIRALAEIEPREVLLGKLAGGLKAPLTAMAGLLAALPRSAATVFQQLLEKRQGEPGAAPEAAAEVVEEAPAGETAEEASPEAAAPDAPATEAMEAADAAAAKAEEPMPEAADAGEEAGDEDSTDDEEDATPEAAATEDVDDDTAESAEEE